MTLSRRDAIDEPCPECGKKDWQLRTLVNAAGVTMYPYVCAACGLQTQIYERKARVEAMASKPPLIASRYPRHKCEVCGARGAELHHWAPFSIFGDEAHRWPQSLLCPACHARWHRLVTPTTGRQ